MGSPVIYSSAPSLAEIHGAILDFYCGTSTELFRKIEGSDVWNIRRKSDGKELDTQVRRNRAAGRFYFEFQPPVTTA